MHDAVVYFVSPPLADSEIETQRLPQGRESIGEPRHAKPEPSGVWVIFSGDVGDGGLEWAGKWAGDSLRKTVLGRQCTALHSAPVEARKAG